MGERAMTFALVNSGPGTCMLDGCPRVRFVTAAGTTRSSPAWVLPTTRRFVRSSLSGYRTQDTRMSTVNKLGRRTRACARDLMAG